MLVSVLSRDVPHVVVLAPRACSRASPATLAATLRIRILLEDVDESSSESRAGRFGSPFSLSVASDVEHKVLVSLWPLRSSVL